MKKQIVGVSSQTAVIDYRSDLQRVKVQVQGSWFRSLPALAGISYAIAWIVGLAAWPSNLAIDASQKEVVSLYAAHRSEATAQYLLVEGLVGLLLGIVLFYCRRHLGRSDRSWRSGAAIAGGVVVTISLLQCLLGLFLGSSASKGYLGESGDLFQVINRLDGAKQLVLSAFVVMFGVLLRTTSNYPVWLWRISVILCVALVASGLSYLLLWNLLASTAFASLPILILWVVGTGIWLGAASQRGSVPITREDLPEHLSQAL